MNIKKAIKNIIGVGINNEPNRIAWVEKQLRQLSPGVKILDAGAGEQRYRSFCTHLNYVAQDFGKYDGKGDGTGLQTKTWDQTKLDIVSDITSIPVPDHSFDAILCTEVFEHIPDPLAALKEFSRILKDGGTLIFTAPFCSATHFAPYHFFSGYNRYFYEYYLPRLGFEIMKLETNGNHFEYVAQELLRLPAMTHKYAKLRWYLWYFIPLFWLLRILKKLSRHDQGSAEFLNFGYHILANKK